MSNSHLSLVDLVTVRECITSFTNLVSIRSKVHGKLKLNTFQFYLSILSLKIENTVSQKKSIFTITKFFFMVQSTLFWKNSDNLKSDFTSILVYEWFKYCVYLSFIIHTHNVHTQRCKKTCK